jgi:hypothetical protein
MSRENDAGSAVTFNCGLGDSCIVCKGLLVLSVNRTIVHGSFHEWQSVHNHRQSSLKSN